jgi:hypothetical protein
MDVQGPVLAVLEAAKAVQDERLLRGRVGSHLLVEEEAVPAETVGQSPDGGVGDTGLSGNLTQSGAGHEAVEGGFEEVVSA